MTLPKLLFGLLILLCVVLGFILLSDAIPDQAGEAHARYTTLQQGAPGRTSVALWSAWAFGLLQLLIFVGCLALGMRKGERLGNRAGWFIGGGLVYILVFSAIFAAYSEYASGDSSLFLSLPLPTAVVIYGLWPMPLFFTVLYYSTFDRWVVTPEDLKRFHELVEQNRRERGTK